MKMNDMFITPTSDQITEFAQKVFGSSINLNTLDNKKRKQVKESVDRTLAKYDNIVGAKKHTDPEYLKVKLVKEALDNFVPETEISNVEYDEPVAEAEHSPNVIAQLKAKYDQLEDENQHGEAALLLVNAFGGKEELDIITAINARHKKRGNIMRSEQQLRDEIANQYYKMLMGDMVGVDQRNEGEEEVEAGSDSHMVDFTAIPETDTVVVSEIIAEYVDQNMEMDSNSKYTYDILIDIDTAEETEESVNESIVVEGQMEQSELILAAKSIVDKYDEMIQDIGEMFNEDLTPLVDKIRDEMGSEIADQFSTAMASALDDSLNNIKNARDSADGAQRILIGDAPTDAPIGDIGDDIPDMEPTIDADELDADEFGASDAAMGGENPIGREKRT
jgi:hypothetical protein